MIGQKGVVHQLVKFYFIFDANWELSCDRDKRSADENFLM